MPVSTRSSTNGFYAIRNGKDTGIYTEWYKAVQAGWRQQEGFGNAVKTDTYEQAEEFISMKPFPSNKVATMTNYVYKQHFLVRVLIFSISTTVLCFGTYNLALKAEKELGCNDLNLSLLPMCKMLTSIKTKVSEHYEKLLSILFYQIMSGILIASSWISGLLKE